MARVKTPFCEKWTILLILSICYFLAKIRYVGPFFGHFENPLQISGRTPFQFLALPPPWIFLCQNVCMVPWVCTELGSSWLRWLSSWFTIQFQVYVTTSLNNWFNSHSKIWFIVRRISKMEINSKKSILPIFKMFVFVEFIFDFQDFLCDYD